jgi:aspartate carbamoyltransferase regulatory subunit
MSPDDLSYKVNKLQRGTVLDHLRAGTALRALRVLKLPPDAMVMVGVNLPSTTHGRKDIIKIDSYELTGSEAAKVALLSPDATISIIRDYQVHGKHQLLPPASFRGLIRCPSPVCIVHVEKMPGSFLVEGRDPVVVRCEYCERRIPQEQFEFVD